MISVIKTSIVRNETALKVLFGSVILAVSAQVYIPLPFVPITGQTLGLTIIALSMGAKLGFLSVLLYILEGCLGLPVFAKHIGGISHLLGPTGGYLIGFVPSVLFMGHFYDNKSLLKTGLVVLGGTCITFIFGLLQLSLFVPIDKLLAVGLYPFIAGGLIKSIVATLTIPRCCEFFKRINKA